MSTSATVPLSSPSREEEGMRLLAKLSCEKEDLDLSGQSQVIRSLLTQSKDVTFLWMPHD